MKILFFSINQGVWPFSFPESLIANSLQLSGNEITYLYCDKVFNQFCLTQNAFQLKYNSDKNAKQQVCNNCTYKRDLLKKKFSFRNFFLDSFITTSEIEKIRNEINKLSLDECLNYNQNNINVGKKALYEFLLNHKKSSLEFTDLEFSEYKNSLINCLITLLALTKFSKENTFDCVLMVNTLYSVNAIAKEIFSNSFVPVYTIHAGLNLSDRYQKILIGKNSTVSFLRNVKNSWNRFKDIRVTQKEAEYVAAHFLELFKGENNYAFSSQKGKTYFDVRKKFNIEKDKKIVVALMSSYDEQFASLQVDNSSFNMIFPTQIEWIKALVQFFKVNQDLYLLIRVHPREFPRNQSTVLSEHAQKLQIEFQSLPSNVKINWPSDNVSLYDLMEETDLFLSAWSSAGKEMSFFGRPVIIYSDDYIFYPHELNIYRSNVEDYFNEIRKNLDSNFDFNRVIMGFRWFALDQFKSIVDINDLSKIYENRDKNIFRRVLKKLLRSVNEKFIFRLDLFNKNKKLKNIATIEKLLTIKGETPLDVLEFSNSVSREDEDKYIKSALKSIYQSMYGSTEYDESYPSSSLRSRLFKILSN